MSFYGTGPDALVVTGRRRLHARARLCDLPSCRSGDSGISEYSSARFVTFRPASRLARVPSLDVIARANETSPPSTRPGTVLTWLSLPRASPVCGRLVARKSDFGRLLNRVFSWITLKTLRSCYKNWMIRFAGALLKWLKFILCWIGDSELELVALRLSSCLSWRRPSDSREVMPRLLRGERIRGQKETGLRCRAFNEIYFLKKT